MWIIRAIITLPLFVAPLAGASGATLKYWSRKAGSYAHNSGPENPKKSLNLAKLRSQKKTLLDHQYFSERKFVGYPLEEIVKSIPRGKTDLVLLHFENGMIIPLPEEQIRQNRLPLKIFLATSIFNEQGKAVTDFPPFVRKDVFLRNYPGLTFSTNKIVVTGLDAKNFSPWIYANSLVGFEFVDQAAYYHQFEVGAGERIRHGQQTFINRCQYCHGVTGVGASYGWDYVTPMPIYKRRPMQELFDHIKYPKAYAIQQGIQMPPQKDITESEVADLWLWLEAISKNPLNKYQP